MTPQDRIEGKEQEDQQIGDGPSTTPHRRRAVETTAHVVPALPVDVSSCRLRTADALTGRNGSATRVGIASTDAPAAEQHRGDPDVGQNVEPGELGSRKGLPVNRLQIGSQKRG